MSLVLIDTPVWIDHLRDPNPVVLSLAKDDRIISHPLVVAELALGSLKDRVATLEYFDGMIMAQDVELSEVRQLIENEKLYSTGIGLVDATLLASCLLQARRMKLWTRDKRLNAIADRFGIAYQPLH